MATIMCIPTKQQLKHLRKLFDGGYTQTTVLRDSWADFAPAVELWHAVNKANEGKRFTISKELRSMLDACISDPQFKKSAKRLARDIKR